jgi:Protein of unknown function (DUF3179)
VRIGPVVSALALITVACAPEATPPPVGAPVSTVAPVLSPIPPVDTSRHSVPLEEIVFDTFDGGSIALSDADPATIERLLDAIPPIDGPSYERPDEADWLIDDDVVLGYIDDAGEAWAYPVKILDQHEILNDVLAGRPVLVSYCPLCASGIVYDRRIGDEILTFSNTSALHENDVVMVDRESGSYWWQVAGTGIVGPRTGAELSLLASGMFGWGDWRNAHPDGAVLVRPTGRDYSRDRFAGYAGLVDAGRTPFPVSDEVWADDRLAAGAIVVAVEVEGEVVAWPVAPGGDVEVTMGERRLRVSTDGVGGAVVDAETGEELPSRTLMWFALVAAEPDVVLAGG